MTEQERKREQSGTLTAARKLEGSEVCHASTGDVQGEFESWLCSYNYRRMSFFTIDLIFTYVKHPTKQIKSLNMRQLAPPSEILHLI